MPLYSYLCRKCRKVSEVLVRGSQTPKCPHCGSAQLTKQASVFAAVRGESGGFDNGDAPSCSSCASQGSCPFGDD